MNLSYYGARRLLRFTAGATDHHQITRYHIIPESCRELSERTSASSGSAFDLHSRWTFIHLSSNSSHSLTEVLEFHWRRMTDRRTDNIFLLQKHAHVTFCKLSVLSFRMAKKINKQYPSLPTLYILHPCAAKKSAVNQLCQSFEDRAAVDNQFAFCEGEWQAAHEKVMTACMLFKMPSWR